MPLLRTPAVRYLLLPALVLAVLALPNVAQAVEEPHTWVSGVGDDANPCSRTAPCKTFAGAISRTTTGGLISVLDPGGFGAVTITKSITIDAEGIFAGVLVSSTNGIVVAAPAGSNVVLRGLMIESIPPCTSANTLHGIDFIGGGSLHVENVAVRGFPGSAIEAKLAADGSSLTVEHSDLREDCTAGVSVATTVGHVAATVSDSFISDVGTAISAGAGAQMFISGNTIVGDGVGLATSAGGVLSSFGNNHVVGNNTDGSPTVELNPPLTVTPTTQTPPPAQTSTTTTSPQPSTTTASPTHATCKVPSLTSKTLAEARKALGKAHCALGTASYHAKKGKKLNRVYAQHPVPGTSQRSGAPVDVTIDGKAPRRRPKAKKAIGGAPRTWVSGVGSDANPCSRTAPCLTFAGAFAKTAEGGTIDALDPGDFGPININTPITIQGAGSSTSIEVAPGETGITVETGAGKNVILRNLNILSSPGCSAPGTGSGIDFKSGGALHLENVTVHGFADSGLKLESAPGALVTLHDSTITDNCANGIFAQPIAGSASVTADGVTLRNNATGVFAGSGATVRLAQTEVSGSPTGLASTGTGVIQGWNDNAIGGNTTNGITPVLLSLI
jgi:hypothetical protein